ncbi:hypothetical protein HMI54_013655 [Coelomomyces lativittatus]|nr:hypothetical protein HMI56_001197 [Coelomomyces lativittatus]KAJ1511161.1 hypothetical protein HMI55_006707 [Coelomomyces lativittatus]KAJ1514730.1 hypothetical protein HMI54_013655 [Coelomomyces lativittatus]
MAYPYSQPPYATTPFPGTSSSNTHPTNVTNRQRNGAPSMSAASYELERQNNNQIDRLHEKTAMLKHLTLTLSDEITESNKFLDGMQTTFVSTEGLLGSTQQKLKKLSQSKGAHLWCTVTAFIFIVFLIGYLVIWH